MGGATVAGMTRRSRPIDEAGAFLLALGRTVLGASAFVAPDALGRFWVGGPAGRTGIRVLSRAMAARDLALGLGALGALGDPGATRSWLRAGAVADAGDAVATVVAFNRLPRRRRVAVACIAGASAAAAWRMADRTGPRRARR